MRFTYERDGQRFTVEGEGDTPPNETELESLWQEHLQSAPAKPGIVQGYIDYKKSPDQKDREMAAKGLPDVQAYLDNPAAPVQPLAGTEQAFQPQPGDITGLPSAMMQGAKDTGTALGPTAVRVGGPIAAALAIPTGVGTLPALTYLAGTGLLSARAAKMLEGNPDPLTPGEGAMAATTAATMAPYAQGVGALRAATLRGVEGAGISASADIEAGRPIDTTNLLFATGLGVAGGAAEGSMLTKAQAIQTAKQAQTYQKIAASSKANEASAAEQAIMANKQRADDFLKAKAELAANDLESVLKESPLASAEPVAIGPLGKEATLDVRLGPGVGAAKERSAFAIKPVQPATEPAMSAQAQRMMDEYGRINPAAMAAVARSGIGAVAGYNAGDTPEEKLGYTIGGALTGAVLSPSLAKRVGKNFATNTAIGRKLAPEVILDPFMEAIRARGGEYDSLLLAPKAALNDMKAALAKVPAAQRDSASAMINDYMHGVTPLANLPKPLADVSLKARQSIDDLTMEMANLGMVKGQSRDTFIDNMGRYMRRSYKIFLDDKWKPSQATFDKWVDANVQDAIANGSTKTPAELRTQFTNTAAQLIDREKATEFTMTGQATIDGSIFKQRKNLDGVTRELLGEIHDPVVLMSDTVPRMARSVAAFKMEKQVADIGEKLGLIKNEAGGGVGQWVPMSKGEKAYDSYAGKFTSPEIRDALASFTPEEKGNILKAYSFMSSAVKVPKTLGSLKAYSSNVWGAGMDLVASGHIRDAFNPKALKEASQMAWYNLTGNNPGAAMDTYKFMVKERLLNKSVTGNDFMTGFNPQRFVRSTAGNAVNAAGRAYMTPESIGKVIQFHGEMRTLNKAYPGMAKDDVMKMAADRVRQTSADFDYVPSAVRTASKYAVLDPFIAYTADRFRVTYNSYRLGLKDIASGNPALAAAGYKRLASTTAVLGAAALIGANTHLSKQQEEALRNRLPERDRNGFLQISEVGKDGSFSYKNLNYTIPQTITMEAAAAAMRGDDPAKAAQNFAAVMQDKLFNSSLVLKPVVDVFRGETAAGKTVWNPQDSQGDIVKQSGQHLASEWFMPLAFKEAQKWANAETELSRKGGERYTKEDLINSNLLGLRTYRIKVDTQMQRQAGELSRAIRGAQGDFSSVRRNDLDPKHVDAAYQQLEKRRTNAFTELTGIVKDARTLGMSDEQVIKVMKDGGVGSKLIAGAMDGIYLPADKNEVQSPADMLAEWKDNGLNIRGEIAKIQGKDRALAHRLMNTYRDENRLALRKVTESDQLLEAFNEADGSRAQYVATKYQNLVKAQGRDAAMAYMKELERKRLVGPETKRILVKAVSQQQ